MIQPNIYIKGALAALFLTLISACGSSDTAVEEVAIVENKQCVTQDDENQDDNCGILLVGLTDADGDFLNYTVEVTGLELSRADGTLISIMPTSQSVNFAEYVDVSELATAATIPAGIYVSGSITIDYSSADVQVEKDGVAVSANMVDSDGVALQTETLQLQLDENNRLIIARNRPAMLEVDFNLAASHTVDLAADPITVTTEPFIVAEVDPVIKKEFRVRGPLLRVNEEQSLFRIAVRPFHRVSGKFGGINVLTDSETNFEIDGQSYVGEEGLTQMANLTTNTATLTLGSFDRSSDNFSAITVIAGSGVPGADGDAATGVIIARAENILTVKGASLIRQSGEVTFNDEISVIIAETTRVSKNRRLQDEVSIADLSIGQAVTLLGDITESDGVTTLDATDGAIRMRLTSASGHAISDDGLTLAINLQALQGRTPDTYDFSGTGIDQASDATAENYEVSIENLLVNNVEADDPIRVTGFINGFGSAPADFNALMVTNYAESRSQVFANWPTGESTTAFSEITSESLTINTDNEEEDGIYKLIQGGIRTDLTSFDSAVVVIPLAERGFYTIKTLDGIISFSNFSDFTSVLQLKLDEGESIDLMHAVGGFSTNNKTLSAIKIAVKLNQP